MDIIDREMLEEMRAVMGDDFQLLLTTLFRDGERRLGLLRDAAANLDRETLRSQAHSLKGSSGNLGAGQLQRACQALEFWAREQGDESELPALLEAVESNYRQAREALEQQ